MSLPTDAKTRKDMPIARGVLDYFPDALAAVAHVSKVGNDQHNPGQPMHWAKGKSTDHPDCIIRHLIDRGKFDSDGLRHSAKVAWRALALLQTELDAEAESERRTLTMKEAVQAQRMLNDQLEAYITPRKTKPGEMVEVDQIPTVPFSEFIVPSRRDIESEEMIDQWFDSIGNRKVQG
ncbi:MAG TPA: dATP/dGTP diphosphohydrolase domain-containing protein [Terriglobales bacterium]|jgi:hypothetical protein|nr:dATP/dGTP diphosphohydrolase domain-containing protein [Terriglobales bacterium]